MADFHTMGFHGNALVFLETFILLWSRARFTSFSLHLPTFPPFELIFSFLFIPLSPSHATFHLIRSALKSSRPLFHFSLQSV